MTRSNNSKSKAAELERRVMALSDADQSQYRRLCIAGVEPEEALRQVEAGEWQTPNAAALEKPKSGQLNEAIDSFTESFGEVAETVSEAASEQVVRQIVSQTLNKTAKKLSRAGDAIAKRVEKEVKIDAVPFDSLPGGQSGENYLPDKL